MKLQKSTLILFATAILLGAGIYFYEYFAKPRQEQIAKEKKRIFTFSQDQIEQLTIETKGTTLQFKRTEDSKNPWRMLQPEPFIASDAAVSFLLNLLVDSQSDRSFQVATELLKDYGLQVPRATITIELKDNKSHQLSLGNSDLEDKYLYAQVDPKPQQQEVEIILVPKEFQYGVERELDEWKQAESTEPEAKETNINN